MPQEEVLAPIPGKIIRVHVNEGDRVNEGDVIYELEAMKMENPIVAPVSGTINKINVVPDQTVKTGDLLAIIQY